LIKGRVYSPAFWYKKSRCEEWSDEARLAGEAGNFPVGYFTFLSGKKSNKRTAALLRNLENWAHRRF